MKRLRFGPPLMIVLIAGDLRILAATVNDNVALDG
jgi:hypothetical protein